MNFYWILRILAERLPRPLPDYLPSRYSEGSWLQVAFRAAHLLYLASLGGLVLLMVAVLSQVDSPTLTRLQEDTAAHYLALLPPHPAGLTTRQVWNTLRHLVSSALLYQNITQNGTLKGMLLLRQFRVVSNHTPKFFPNCDFSQLDKADRRSPPNASILNAWRFSSVHLTAAARGRWCTYPQEGYAVFLGDVVGTPEQLPTRPNETLDEPAPRWLPADRVLQDGLQSLDLLQSNHWLDNKTCAILLTVATVELGMSMAATVTITFENFEGSRNTSGGDSQVWWTSHSMAAVDLRQNSITLALFYTFLVIHILVTALEIYASPSIIRISRLQRSLGEVARRCTTMATGINLAILALHVALIITTFSAARNSQLELDKYSVAYELIFSTKVKLNDEITYDAYYHGQSGESPGQGHGLKIPGFGEHGHSDTGAHGGTEDKGANKSKAENGTFEHENQNASSQDPKMFRKKAKEVIRPAVWRPEYQVQVRRIQLANVMYWKYICSTLIKTEIMLYMINLAIFRQYHGRARQVINTLRGGLLWILLTAAPILALGPLIACLVHVQKARGVGEYITLASCFKATLISVLGLGESGGDPEGLTGAAGAWLTRVVVVAAGATATVLLWRVCRREDGEWVRTRRRPPFLAL